MAATNRVDKEKIFKDSSGYSGGWLKGVGECISGDFVPMQLGNNGL